MMDRQMDEQRECARGVELGNAATARPVDVMLVDRASVLRVGLAHLISQEPDFKLVGEAATITEAEHVAANLSPDLLIVEPDLPDAAGSGAIARLRAACPQARIVVLSHLDSARSIRSAFAKGVRGYIVKYGPYLDLMSGLRVVLKGRRHLCSVAAMKLRRARHAAPVEENKIARGISSREREVLTMIAAGNCNKRTAAAMRLSVKTVEKHRANLMRKLSFTTWRTSRGLPCRMDL